MKNFIHSAIKKVTLELIYEIVDERTQDIKEHLGRLEDDTREIRNEMNRRFEAVDRRLEALTDDMNRRFEAMENRFETLNGRIDQRFEALNARIDQLFNLITSQQKS